MSEKYMNYHNGLFDNSWNNTCCSFGINKENTLGSVIRERNENLFDPPDWKFKLAGKIGTASLMNSLRKDKRIGSLRNKLFNDKVTYQFAPEVMTASCIKKKAWNYSDMVMAKRHESSNFFYNQNSKF